MKTATVVFLAVLAVLAVFQGCASQQPYARQQWEQVPAAQQHSDDAIRVPAKGLRLVQSSAPAYTAPPTAQYSGVVADAPQDYCPAGNTKDQPSVAYKQMYAPRWGGHVRQASFYNGYTRDIFSQYPPSDEMNRFWERLLALPPKQGLPEWGPSYYARWALASGRWTLIESSPCEGCPQPQVRAPQYQAPAIVVQRPASPPPPVYYQPAAAPPVIYQTASPAPATAHAPKPRATYSNPACVKRLEEWGYSGRDGIKEFQRKLDIRVDGVAGPETCRYVRQILANCESKERCDP